MTIRFHHPSVSREARGLTPNAMDQLWRLVIGNVDGLLSGIELDIMKFCLLPIVLKNSNF
jgi:hypothetical protein